MVMAFFLSVELRMRSCIARFFNRWLFLGIKFILVYKSALV